ncbi:hypothetical protein COU57_00075 [Candidatus Pacearchaeota archaeon CG10_big_fil_rev_8_21_14_0_10_32_14]|nr:MAG: hypothetical protein COU57_00075 [Candidatus Pacearchaeota archaeon CG10_big_fil_rev_8_21_14_0_10_32_14]
MVKKNIIKKIKFAILIFMIVASLLVVIFSKEIVKGNIFEKKDLHNDLSSVFIYIAWMVFAASTTFPITTILIPGIFLFSFGYALIYTYVGIVLGALTIYYLSIYLGRDFVNDYTGIRGDKIKIVKGLVEKESFGFLLVLNAFYFFPSNLAHVVAGITKTKFWKFFIPTILANFLNFFFVALLTLGIAENNKSYIYGSTVALFFISVIPLIIYRKHLKEIIYVSFSKEAYKDFKKL